MHKDHKGLGMSRYKGALVGVRCLFKKRRHYSFIRVKAA
jgi:hypothetical protein